MKVEKIAQLTAKSQNSNVSNLHKTDFGQNRSVREQETSFNSKMSNEAIRNLGLANLSFCGYEDNIIINTDKKYLRPGDESSLIKIHHARLEKDGTKASSDNLDYVVKEVITESPHYLEGSFIDKTYIPNLVMSPAFKFFPSDNSTGTVYYTDPNEELDEDKFYGDYVVMAPGAKYTRPFLRELFN